MELKIAQLSVLKLALKGYHEYLYKQGDKKYEISESMIDEYIMYVSSETCKSDSESRLCSDMEKCSVRRCESPDLKPEDLNESQFSGALVPTVSEESDISESNESQDLVSPVSNETQDLVSPESNETQELEPLNSDESSELESICAGVMGLSVKDILLPYNGINKEGNCSGLRVNEGLYTQCENIKHDVSSKYCHRCLKESKKNEDGKPNAGDIEDRLKVGIMDYVDRKGKKVIHYSKIMKKHKYSEEEVRLYCKNKEIVLDEVHFLKKVKEKREKENKGGVRGRPRKNKKTEVEKEVSAGVELDMDMKVEEEVEVEVEEVEEEVEEEESNKGIVSIVEEEKESNVLTLKEIELDEELSEEMYTEEIEDVVRIRRLDKTYLKSLATDLIYTDDENQEVVGRWDVIKNDIDFSYKNVPYEEDEDEDEDE